MTADIGWPLPIGLPTVTMSGRTPVIVGMDKMVAIYNIYGLKSIAWAYYHIRLPDSYTSLH